MSADQLRRAAEVAQKRAGATYRLDEAADAVAALLRAGANCAPLALHDWHRITCRHHDTTCRYSMHHGCASDAPCVRCLLDDVAAAYLGEDPQP